MIAPPEAGTCAYLPQAITFDARNFQELKPAQLRIGYVDGGSADILTQANASITLIRTYSCIWGSKREFCKRTEESVLVQTTGGKTMRLQTSTGEAFSVEESGLRTGNHQVTPMAVASHLRRLREISCALALCDQHPHLIVLDGSLETSTAAEETLMEELRQKCKRQNTRLAGLSKSSTLITNTGAGLADSLAKLTTLKTWKYHPLADQCEIHMAKLHELGALYRIDGDQEAADALCAHSKDAALPGYPYPLIEADNLARITTNETQRFQLVLSHTQQPNNVHDLLNTITAR